jgi:hypothetical protein
MVSHGQARHLYLSNPAKCGSSLCRSILYHLNRTAPKASSIQVQRTVPPIRQRHAPTQANADLVQNSAGQTAMTLLEIALFFFLIYRVLRINLASAAKQAEPSTEDLHVETN